MSVNNKKILYSRWNDMMRRCYNPHRNSYDVYGGRGIQVDESWHDFNNFYKDMNSTYAKGLSLERIDNNANYSKVNCKWANRREQSRNKRNNHFFTFRGKTLILADWAEIVGIKRTTLSQRYFAYKWSIEKCLTKGGINWQ